MPIIRTFARNSARAKGLGTNSSVFRVVPSVTSANEGTTITFTITTQNFGTLQTQPNVLGSYTSPGTYSYTVPAGVTSIQAIAIGGGGGGSAAPLDAGNAGQGGGGGGGAYKNNIQVSQGDTLSIVVGSGGAGAPVSGGTGTSGGASSVTLNGSTVLVRANGGIAGGLATYIPAGQVAYTTPGTYSWTAPAGITSVSVVAVGAGGGGVGLSDAATNAQGGGGGALAYANNISVTPGQTYQVIVGAGGPGGLNDSSGTAGGLSSFSTQVSAGGGGAGFRGGSSNNKGIVIAGTGFPGGRGEGSPGWGTGGGGGGAGGYSGAGGDGRSGSGGGGYGSSGDAGTGGSGGGGSPTYYGGICGGSGGGVGILGEGTSGAGSQTDGYTSGQGNGGSGGGNGTVSRGGSYGGGGGGCMQYGQGPASGGGGAVRIIWAGTSGVTRSFPSTNTQDIIDTTAGVAAAGGAGVIGDVLGIGGRGGAGDGGTIASRAGSGYYAAGGGGYHSSGSPFWGGSGGGGSGLSYPPSLFAASQNAQGAYDASGIGGATVPGSGINGGSSGSQGNQSSGSPYSGTNNGASGGAGGGYGAGGGGASYNSAGGAGAGGAVRISQIETVPIGTLYWTTIAQSGTVNASDFSDTLASGAVTINNNTGTITRTLANDLTTEGVESFALQIRTDSTNGPIVAQSPDVSINDTSGTVTYNIVPRASSVSEGSSIVFDVTTTNFGTGPLYWSTNTVSGTINSSDFTDGVLTGTVSIASNAGTITRTLVNDSSTEGTEQFTLTLYTDSARTNAQVTSSTVSISDTSVTPPYYPPYYAPYYPPYYPPYYAPYYAPYSVSVSWPGPGWSIDVPADGTGYSQTVTVTGVSGSGTYAIVATSRPTAVSTDPIGYGPSYSISAGQSRSHSVTVYASPVGSGWSGSFQVDAPGGTSFPWTGNFRAVSPYYPPYYAPYYAPAPYVPPYYAPTYNEGIDHPSYAYSGQIFDVHIYGGVPNTGFGYAQWGGGISGGGSLDSSGQAYIYGVRFDVNNTTTYNFSWFFAGTGNYRYTSILVDYLA